MTTEDTTIEVAEDRPVSVLASLDTYQGMTDSEIESLIQWKIECAVDAADNDAIRTQNNETNAGIVASQASIVAETQALLDSLRAQMLSLGSVEGSVAS